MSLADFATERDKEYLEAIEKHGSHRKAAEALGVHSSSIDRAMQALKRRAAQKGFSPEHDLEHPVPDGYMVKGASSYYNKDGELTGQWIKSQIDPARMEEMVREAIEAMVADLPAVPVHAGPAQWQEDVIPWVQIGDAHLGMLAHAHEVGENFDLKIAERELCGAISVLIDELPSCERLVINDLGDATHYQGFPGISESGHAFDIDTRFPKMIKVYCRVMRFIVERALTKARNVDVIINQGNHSRTNDIWMGEFLRALYGHTGRVHVLNNESVFIAYRMGKTLVLTHHSDKCKPSRLVHVMTNDYRKDYGETEFHYIDIGHVHHGMVMKEHPGIFVESFNHLAALDRWAHDSGYRNRKSITIILRSKTYGEVGRRVLPIQEVRDRLVNAAQKISPEREVYTV